MGNIIKALLLIWELPQNIAGAFYFIIHGVYAKTFIIDDEDSFEMYSDKQFQSTPLHKGRRLGETH